MGQIKGNDSQSLKENGIRPNTTVIMLKKKPTAVVEKEESNPESYKTLESAIRNPLYKRTLKKILKDRDSLESLLAIAPTIRQDPVALALLRDPDLLATISETVFSFCMSNI